MFVKQLFLCKKKHNLSFSEKNDDIIIIINRTMLCLLSWSDQIFLSTALQQPTPPNPIPPQNICQPDEMRAHFSEYTKQCVK